MHFSSVKNGDMTRSSRSLVRASNTRDGQGPLAHDRGWSVAVRSGSCHNFLNKLVFGVDLEVARASSPLIWPHGDSEDGGGVVGFSSRSAQMGACSNIIGSSTP
jgi:hypothetical protein